MTDTTPRPSHTTIAAGMVIAGSVMVVVTVGEQIAAIHSLETRQMVSQFLAETGTGLDVPAALVVFRTAMMVVAGCATAAAILGYHVLKRSRRARLGLTLLAVPLFFGGLFTGGFLTSLVAASSMLLWVGPSRAWLDRKPLPEPPDPWGTRRPPASWPPPPPTTERTDVPPPHAGTYGAPPPPEPPARVPDKRPDAVVWACVLTWAFSALTVALLGASLTLLVADASLVFTELERQNPELLAETGFTRDDMLRTLYVVLGAAVAWAVLAMVLAAFAYRRRAGARVGLMVCAGLAGALCVTGGLSAGVLLVPGLACLATVLLLTRANVRAWFAARPPQP